jgi:hypothetical protein
MPNTRRTESKEARLARLEQQGRRCDGYSRNCESTAVLRIIVLPADGFGNPREGVEEEVKLACSYHKRNYLHSGAWNVVRVEEFANRNSAPRPMEPALAAKHAEIQREDAKEGATDDAGETASVPAQTPATASPVMPIFSHSTDEPNG